MIKRPQQNKPQPVEPQREESGEFGDPEEHSEEPEFEYMEPDKKTAKTVKLQNEEVTEKNRNDFDLSDSTMEFLGSVDSEKKKVNEGTDDEMDQLLKEMEDMDF